MSGDNVPQHYVQQFATNIRLLLQQKRSRLRGSVSENANYRGKQVSPVDQVGAVEMQTVNDRFAPITRSDLPLARRWVVPIDFDLAIMVDNFDKLRLLLDPTSTYVQAAVAAGNRALDGRIIDAFFADALIGETGNTTESWASFAGQVVAVNQGASGPTGLTAAKLKRARRILRGNEALDEGDGELINIAITAAQEEQLLHEAEVISLDYNSQPVLKDGRLDTWLGYKFHHTQRLKTDSDGYRRIPVWMKDGMHLAIWQDMVISVDRRRDLRGHPWQIYVHLTANATRLEPEKIVEIKCAE